MHSKYRTVNTAAKDVFPFQAKTNQNLSKFLTKALYASEQLTV